MQSVSPNNNPSCELLSHFVPYVCPLLLSLHAADLSLQRAQFYSAAAAARWCQEVSPQDSETSSRPASGHQQAAAPRKPSAQGHSSRQDMSYHDAAGIKHGALESIRELHREPPCSWVIPAHYMSPARWPADALHAIESAFLTHGRAKQDALQQLACSLQLLHSTPPHDPPPQHSAAPEHHPAHQDPSSSSGSDTPVDDSVHDFSLVHHLTGRSPGFSTSVDDPQRSAPSGPGCQAAGQAPGDCEKPAMPSHDSQIGTPASCVEASTDFSWPPLPDPRVSPGDTDLHAHGAGQHERQALALASELCSGEQPEGLSLQEMQDVADAWMRAEEQDAQDSQEPLLPCLLNFDDLQARQGYSGEAGRTTECQWQPLPAQRLGAPAAASKIALRALKDLTNRIAAAVPSDDSHTRKKARHGR